MSDKYRGGRTDSQRQHYGSLPEDVWSFLRDTAESLRSTFDQRGEPRTKHRDVRATILSLLVEEPMHGHQIIREIEARSAGAWVPSPGSVYPTLQLLVDEGLIVAQEAEGKKLYSATDSGKRAAEASGPFAWETLTDRDAAHSMLLPKAGAKLAQAAAQLAHGGTPEQVREAVAVMDDARRKIYAILARE